MGQELERYRELAQDWMRALEAALDAAGVKATYQDIVESDSPDPFTPEYGNQVFVGFRYSVEHCGQVTTTETRVRNPIPLPPGAQVML